MSVTFGAADAAFGATPARALAFLRADLRAVDRVVLAAMVNAPSVRESGRPRTRADNDRRDRLFDALNLPASIRRRPTRLRPASGPRRRSPVTAGMVRHAQRAARLPRGP